VPLILFAISPNAYAVSNELAVDFCKIGRSSLYKVTSQIIVSLLGVFIVSGLSEAEIIPERRKPQFQNELGYYVFPTPYSIPGIGEGLSLFAIANNIGGTYTDVGAGLSTGAVHAYGIGASSIHLVPRMLILDAGYGKTSSATVRNYSQRGMATNKNDFTLVEFGDAAAYGGRLTATFFDRRFEIYGAGSDGTSKLRSIRDKKGNDIIKADNPDKTRYQSTVLGILCDVTDDYSDPRKGLRLDIRRSWSPPKDRSADYYVMSYNTTAYFPVGRRSTWVFNYARADAVVTKMGETDRNQIAQDQGLKCDTLIDPQQKLLCEQVISSTVAANTYGTVSSLGGTSRLRSYPEGRYTGSHSQFYGTELRWNLTDEYTPFNLYFAKDIRTGFQVALFYEIGSVADIRSELNKIMRSSYGLGFRIVTASGFVLRADLVALGREGNEMTMIFGYPWEF
jgi:hypothetical protein